jgi:hypothetical protein
MMSMPWEGSIPKTRLLPTWWSRRGLNSGENVSDTNKSGILSANHNEVRPKRRGDSLSETSSSIDSTGLGSSPSGCTISANSTNCQRIFYVISGGQVVMMTVAPADTSASIMEGILKLSGDFHRTALTA